MSHSPLSLAALVTTVLSFCACVESSGAGGPGAGAAAGEQNGGGSGGAAAEQSDGGSDNTGGFPPEGVVVGGGPANTDFAEPTECELSEVTVTPSDLSPTDGCLAVYHCSGVDLQVHCDGENDGSGTSLCSCESGGQSKYGGLVNGEGETACAAGFSNCIDPGCCQ